MSDDRSSILTAGQRAFLIRHRVGRLATVDRRGHPSVVPICYALVDDTIYSPLDEKPKSVPLARLQRVRNLLASPSVALVVDEYAEDWSQLAYLLVRGRASLIEPGSPEHGRAIVALRTKYPQYDRMALEERPAIRIVPERAHGWSPGVDRFRD